MEKGTVTFSLVKGQKKEPVPSSGSFVQRTMMVPRISRGWMRQ
jgi:hypothetical protein